MVAELVVVAAVAVAAAVGSPLLKKNLRTEKNGDSTFDVLQKTQIAIAFIDFRFQFSLFGFEPSGTGT
jgi:hypothetical protein